MNSQTVLSMNWGGDSAKFPSYQGFMNTTSSAAAPPSTSSAAPSSGGSPAASPAAGSNTGGSPATTGAQGGSPPSASAGAPGTGAQVDWATAPEHFRREYETLKQSLDPYSKLGDHETVSSHVNFVKAAVSEAFQAGQALGYTEQEISDALSKDAVNTVYFLRSKLAERTAAQGGKPGQGGDDQADVVRKLIEKEISPIKSHLEKQQVEAANASWMSEFNKQLTEAYPDSADMPKEFRDLLEAAVSESFKYDKQSLSDLKFKGQTAGVAKHFQQMRNSIEKAFTVWQQYQMKKAGGANRRQGGGQGESAGGNGDGGDSGLTLEDVIAGTDKAIKAIPSMRR